MDGSPLFHVPSYSLLGPGKWYFEWSGIGLTGTAYLYYAGSTLPPIRLSDVEYAFGGTNSNVTIQGLTIAQYASPEQRGVVGGNVENPQTGWKVQFSNIVNNHGVGARLGDGALLQSSVINGNGQLGVNIVFGANQRVEYNEIGNNNRAWFDPTWEGGATKFWSTENLIARGNYVHDNKGPGLWADTDNTGTLYESNYVTRNLSEGIVHEVGTTCIIRDNVASFNGYSGTGPGWLYNANIQLKNAPNCEIDGNLVIVEPHGGNGIAVMTQRRDDVPGTVCAATECMSLNSNIHDNIVSYPADAGNPAPPPQDNGPGHSGIVTDFRAPNGPDPDDSYWDIHGSIFDCNLYYYSVVTDRRFAIENGWMTFSGFQSLGYDLTGGLNPSTRPSCFDGPQLIP